jgi:dihydrofolate reductase
MWHSCGYLTADYLGLQLSSSHRYEFAPYERIKIQFIERSIDVMTKVILGMTISLDGFVNDRSGSVSELYPDLAALQDTGPMRESIQNTGAVVMGRNSFAMADDPDTIADHYEYQVPIFVLTHSAAKKKPKENGQLTFTFVTDGIESAIAQARAAAGEKDM